MRDPRTTLISALLLGASVWLAGCGDDDEDDEDPPEDVSGEYSVAVTNRANTCEVENWEEGSMASGIPLVIEQDGSEITGTIEGIVSLYLIAVTGNNEFEGSVSGDDFTMTSYGTTSPVVDGCSFTWNAIIDGELSGNSIEGTVTYQRSPNDDPDCAGLACANVQDFSGSRPPK